MRTSVHASPRRPAWPPPPIRRSWLRVHDRDQQGGLGDSGGASPGAPPLPSRAWALPTDVSLGQEGDQFLPPEHLLLVLEVGEAVGGAAHQLEACDARRWLSCCPPARSVSVPGLHRGGTEASLPVLPSEDPEEPGRGEGAGLAGRGQGWLLTWEELVLPEQIQVAIQVGEVVAQALLNGPPTQGHAMSGQRGAGPRLEPRPRSHG